MSAPRPLPHSQPHHGSFAGDESVNHAVDALFATAAARGQPRETSIANTKVCEFMSLKDAVEETSQSLKSRVMILSSGEDGTLHLHKSRQNNDGTIQIGRTWDLGELNSLQLIASNPRVLLVSFRKPYYWKFSSVGELRAFVDCVARAYQPYTGSHLHIHEASQHGTDPAANPGSVAPPSRSANRIREVPSPATASGPAMHSNQAVPPPGQNSITPVAVEQANIIPQRSMRRPSPIASTEPLSVRSDLQTVVPEIPAPSHLRSVRNSDVSPTVESHGFQNRSQPGPRSLPQPPGRTTASPSPNLDRPEMTQFSRENQAPEVPHHQIRGVNGSLGSQSVTELPGEPSRQRPRELPQVPNHRQLSQPAVPAAQVNSAISDIQLEEPIPRSKKRQQSVPLDVLRGHSELEDNLSGSLPPINPLSINRNNTLPLDEFDDLNELPDEGLAQREKAQNRPTVQPTAAPKSPIAIPDRDASRRIGNHEEMKQPPRKSIQPTNTEGVDTFDERPLPSRETDHVGRQHKRDLSSSSSMLHGSHHTNEDGDLTAVINEFHWSGDSVTGLESDINEKINQLRVNNISDVADLEDHIEELDTLLAEGIEECSRMDKMMAAFALQLAAIGEEVQNIEGMDDGVQVVSANKRALHQELKELLKTFNRPEKMMPQLENARFDDVRQLPEVEKAVAELYRAVRVSNVGSGDGMGDMRALEGRKGDIVHMTNAFSKRFEEFLTQRLDTLPVPEADKQGTTINISRLDTVVLKELNVYNGLILFVKEAEPKVFAVLVKAYEHFAQSFYNTQFTAFSKQWSRGMDGVVGSRPPYAIQLSQHLNAAMAVQHMPNVALRKAKATKGSQGDSAVNNGSKTDDNAASNGGGGSGKSKYFAIPVSFGLGHGIIQLVYQQMKQIVVTLALHIPAQQQVLRRLFHMTSLDSSNFDIYIQRVPVQKRILSNYNTEPEIQGVDPSKSVSLAVLDAMTKIFGRQMNQLIETCSKAVKNNCELESTYMIALLEAHIRSLRSSDQEYLLSILEALRSQLVQLWNSHSERQTRSILGARVSTKKRIGVLPMVARFSEHIRIIEEAYNSASASTNAPETRRMIDMSHESLFRAIMQGFQQSETPAMVSVSHSAVISEENKAVLNRHVMLIENLSALFAKIEQFNSSDSIQQIIVEAKQVYRKEVELYIEGVIHRPLGKIIDYVVQNEAPATSAKAMKQKHRVAALKRSVSGYDSKELRKSVETLRKRVDKHFGDGGNIDATLVDKIWRAIGAQFMDYYNRLLALARSCDSESVIEFTKQDVQNAFR